MKKLTRGLRVGAAIMAALGARVAMGQTTNPPGVIAPLPGVVSPVGGYQYPTVDANGNVTTPTNLNGSFSGYGGGLSNLSINVSRRDQGMLPEMGLNTFQSYGTHITEALVKAGIDGMVTNGYRDAGYVTYTIDDGWTYPCNLNVDPYFTNASNEIGHAGRANDGTILADTNRFPGATGTDSLKYLADYAHARGMKLGVYMDAGVGCTSGKMTGTGGWEQKDINTVASWGIDSIKFDQGGMDQAYYAKLSQYCLDSGRQIYLSGAAGGLGRSYGTWIPNALNAWRPVPSFPNDPNGLENGDMHPPWTNLMAHLDSFIRDARFIGPGHVPDGDQAINTGGTGDGGQAVRSIMTIWALYSCGMHITGAQPTSGEREWLTNSEVIAIDQDAAVMPASIVSSNAGMMVFSKPLGSAAPLRPKAVGFLNRNFGPGTNTATVNFTNIGLLNGVATVRDVWQRCVIGYYTNSFTCPPLAATNASLYKITGGVEPPFRYGTNYLGDDDVWYLAAGLTNNGVQYYGVSWVPPGKNMTVNGVALTNNGTAYARGLSIMPGNGTVAQLSYFLGGKVNWFHAEVGLDDSATLTGAINATASIYLDGVQVWTAAMSATSAPANPAIIVDLDLTGKTNLTIKSTSSGANGQTDFLNAYLIQAMPSAGGSFVGSIPAQSLKVGNALTNYAYDFSVNTWNMPNLEKGLQAKKKLKFLWWGDSTGWDDIQAMQNFLNANYLYGAEKQIINTGPISYWNAPSGSANAYGIDPAWWSSTFVLTNGTTQVFGTGPVYVNASDLKFWYIAGANRGTCVLRTSTDNSTWTPRMTVDTSVGSGIKATNISIYGGNAAPVNVQISTTVGGTENRVVFLWPQLRNTNVASVEIFDGHHQGDTMAGFIAMGTNSIATILTNYNPDVIFWQQTKAVADYTNLATLKYLFQTYATNADWVILSTQCAATNSVNADPLNGVLFQLQQAQAFCLTNGVPYPYVDKYSTMNQWTNFIAANAFNADANIHLNAAGQLFSGYLTIDKLHFVSQMAAAGLLAPVVTTSFNIVNTGTFKNIATNALGTTTTIIDAVANNEVALWLCNASESQPWALMFDNNTYNTYLRSGNGGGIHFWQGAGPSENGVVDPTGNFNWLGPSLSVATNAVSAWPTVPPNRGAAAIVSSNGYPYLLMSTNGTAGSLTWTGTNKLGW